MSEIVVRPYEPRDQAETWNVRAMTYNSGRPIPVEQQVYKTSTPFVGEIDGHVVGTFVIMDMTCTRGAVAAWKTGGIAGVAVLPEARRTGVGGAMMRWSLRYMREQGYVMGALYAFRESYYRKFGYEVCGLRYKVTCPQSRLPKCEPELPVRRILKKDIDEIKACHEAFSKARSGMNLREEFHWGRMMSSDEGITLYAAGDPVEAYAFLEHDWTFWNEQPVVEFAWSSRRGYESMLAHFGSVGINKTALTWHEPPDSPFVARHLDQGVRIESEKPIMYRLLNPAAALESMSPAGEGRFSFSMRDPDLPQNEGALEVCYSGGRARVERTDSAEIGLDPQTAVQAFLGQPSFADLVRNGSVAPCEAAERLFPPSPVFCLEHF